MQKRKKEKIVIETSTLLLKNKNAKSKNKIFFLERNKQQYDNECLFNTKANNRILSTKETLGVNARALFDYLERKRN